MIALYGYSLPSSDELAPKATAKPNVQSAPAKSAAEGLFVGDESNDVLIDDETDDELAPMAKGKAQRTTQSDACHE